MEGNEGTAGTKQPVKFGGDGMDSLKSAGTGKTNSTPGSKGQGHIRKMEGSNGG